MKTKIFKNSILLALIALFLIQADGNAAPKKNPYHNEGTPEYEQVTAKLIGEWNIESFMKKKDELMGVTYEKATVEFGYIGNNERWGEATFRFYIARSIIDERIAPIKKNDDEVLTVDSYVVVTTVKYRIHKKGKLIYLEDQMNLPEIEGSGTELEKFRGLESSLLATQAAMSNSGGLDNMIGAQIMKQASKTDFVPAIPTQINYEDLTDNGVVIKGIGKVKWEMTK